MNTTTTNPLPRVGEQVRCSDGIFRTVTFVRRTTRQVEVKNPFTHARKVVVWP